MRISSMSQLAIAVKESFATITIDRIDRHTEENSMKEVTPSIQNRYIDSVEFSDRALELYMNTDSRTSVNEKLDTDQGLEESPDANQQQQQPALARAVSLINAFA
ncbi:MAG TPA: hypothetical protein QF423_06335 [Candidatus Scalindua sp.]|nr:hypothetical protein [Candidatus Scalindua sp.]